jgi:hypothetical protein
MLMFNYFESDPLLKKCEIFGLLTNIPANAISFQEAGEEGYGICEDHDTNEDQESATHKGHATEIGAQTFEIAQEGIHAEGRQEKG